ncbi:nucleotide-binding universal stress UspA family protein [Methanohalophilus levihalophilus]|uniref:universal stress protein n=1 Tax=Methanohalophilus levihalophilus TaxID=1431282 RepID=UPI001AE790B9|nr:nucleotide-binding universal stress UspA family protein [Methanohalophilus levihalophilus]
MRISRILVATDNSRPACNAGDAAVRLASSTDAAVTAVFVIPQVFPQLMPGRELMLENRVPHAAIQKEGEIALAKIEKLCDREKVDFGGLIVEGHPVNEIIRVADELDIDLIIMGCLGRSGMDRFLLGSVAENVLRHSKRPVLMVR